MVEILEAGTPYWAFVVSDTEPNANDIIRQTNQFNDPPEPGRQFYMVELEAKYLGSDSEIFAGNFRIKALGQSGVVYAPARVITVA